MVDHVLNRGNGRLRSFHKEGDFDAFERVLVEGLKRYPVDLLTYCLMPNHWHLVVRPRTDVALGRLMGWVGVTQVRRRHEHYHRRGARHLDQGRFKRFPVAEDDDFLMLCRYVEANTVRGKLVERAEQWRWCGLWRRAHYSIDLVFSPWPVERPRELENLGQCRPVGGRAASGAGVRGTGPPIGNSAIGAGDHRAAEAGLHTSRTRPAPKDNRQSVMTLFLSPLDKVSSLV